MSLAAGLALDVSIRVQIMNQLEEVQAPLGVGYIFIGKETYLRSADGHLMPTKKGQQPPDLRYFNTTGN